MYNNKWKLFIRLNKYINIIYIYYDIFQYIYIHMISCSNSTVQYWTVQIKLQAGPRPGKDLARHIDVGPTHCQGLQGVSNCWGVAFGESLQFLTIVTLW